MLKVLMIFIVFSTLLEASSQKNTCKLDMDNMIATYFVAEKLETKKEYAQALIKYNESNFYANKALLSCQDSPKYDFRIMHNYIVASENKSYQLQEL